MYVAELDLLDFRSYEKLNLALVPGITALTGANGAGKTNLVEAIYFAATLGSHRVSGKAPLIRQGAERAIIRLRARAGERTSAIELEIPQTGSGRARVNGGQVIPVGQTRGIVRAVMFSPEDLTIIKGEPDIRRRFIDDLVLQARPTLFGYYRDYEQILRQRNAFLKNARQFGKHDDTMHQILTEQLIQVGIEITTARILLIATIQPLVASAYQQIADTTTPTQLALVLDGPREELSDGSVDAQVGTPAIAPDAPQEQTPQLREQLAAYYQQQFAAKYSQELARGYTLVGPHRDDLALTLAGLPAKGYASHGETWSLALALKLAAFTYLKHQYAAAPNAEGAEQSQDSDPILILDDVFAELDEKRRSSLTKAIKDVQQVFITSAVASDIPAELDFNMFRVENGSVQ